MHGLSVSCKTKMKEIRLVFKKYVGSLVFHTSSNNGADYLKSGSKLGRRPKSLTAAIIVDDG